MRRAPIAEALAKAFKVATPEELAERTKNEDRRNRVAAMTALKASGCPAVVLSALDQCLPTGSLSKAQEWQAKARNEVWWLVLLGNTGVGKTTAAAYAARWALYEMRLAERPSGSRQVDCRWITGAELGRLYTHDRDAARDWEAIKAAAVLVVDDLGTESVDDRAREAIWELVEARTGHRRPTMLTSNLSASAFKARYGERVADRLRPCSVVSQGGGESLRK